MCAAPTRPRQWRGTLPRHRGGRIEHTPAGWLIGDEEVFLMIFLTIYYFKFYLQMKKIYLIDNDKRLTINRRFVCLSKLLFFSLILIN